MIKYNSKEANFLNNFIEDLKEEYYNQFYSDFHFTIYTDEDDNLLSVEFVFRANENRDLLRLILSEKPLSIIKEEIVQRLFQITDSQFN